MIALVVLVLTAQFLRRDPREMGQSPDGCNELEEECPVPEVGGFSLRDAIHTRQFKTILAAYFCVGIVMASIFTHMVPYATDLGIPAIAAASIIAVVGGTNIVGRIGVGGISDRLGMKLAFVIGMGLMLTSLVWLQFAVELWKLHLFAILFGIGNGGLIASQALVVADLFGFRAHGVILGVLMFSIAFGSSIGSIMTGRIFDVTGSYQLAFSILIGVSIVSLILVALLKPIRWEDYLALKS
jgi:MFS family permease